jgi:hypothetical protein
MGHVPKLDEMSPAKKPAKPVDYRGFAGAIRTFNRENHD